MVNVRAGLWSISSLVLGLTLLSAGVRAQPDEEVRIETQPVAAGIYMLTGSGGNLGVSVGADGAFVIDDQYEPLSERLLAAIGELGGKPVRFVLNTHWHLDHTGGNENFAATGAVVLAHENVRTRLERGQLIRFLERRIDPAPAAALPVITFREGMNLFLNGEEIEVFHAPAAHTDGDSLVYFRTADVLHMGDTYFAGMYPFIDRDSGGSLEGALAAIDAALERIGDETRIIPGHGPLSGTAELRAYRDMLQTIGDRVRTQLAGGASCEQVIASRPSADFDARFGGGFIAPARWIALLCDLLGAGSTGG
jgi:glyoxylase-like metal-dependent hydrolase (beta-lactamase superfamily II)